MINENIDETVLIEAIGAAEAEVIYINDTSNMLNSGSGALSLCVCCPS